MTEPRVTARNARFQQWQSYLTNRGKRTRAGCFVVQGVRPISLAVASEWPVETVLYRLQQAPLSAWARELLNSAQAPAVGISAELMGELGDKPDQPPEILLIARTRRQDLTLWTPPTPDAVVVVLDRPSSPGNLGTLVRSADAFGASAVIVAGHGADPVDPQSVRASTGSVFGLPVFQVAGSADVIDAVSWWRAAGIDARVVGTDETGARAIFDCDLTGPTVLIVGNETRGMSAAWRAACDDIVSIPIAGLASSLGAPSAGAVSLYEVARQRARVAVSTDSAGSPDRSD